MNQTHNLELPEDIYSALVKAAREKGTSPADWIAKNLPKPSLRVSDEERSAANRRLREHIVSLGYATGSDNEGIDADLVREYGASCADTNLPSGPK